MPREKYTVAQLKADIKNLPDNEEIVVIMEDNPNTTGEEYEDLEPGAVLDISEAGGYFCGMWVIRVLPR